MAKTYNIGSMKSRDSSSSPWENLLIQVREQYSDPESLANKALTNVKTPGLYYCPDSTTKATIYGCPADLGNVFTMAVYKVGSGGQVVQMIVSDDLMFTRRIDGATVTEWAKYSPGDSVNLEAIADEYDSSLAYDEGDYVIHDGMLYICTTDIPSGGETWNASHWKETNVVSEMNGWKTITGDGVLDSGFVATDLTGAVNELKDEVLDNAAIIGDGELSQDFTATDLTGAANELKDEVLNNAAIIGDGELSQDFTATDLTGAANELKTGITGKVSKAGDTMTGSLTMSENAKINLQGVDSENDNNYGDTSPIHIKTSYASNENTSIANYLLQVQDSQDTPIGFICTQRDFSEVESLVLGTLRAVNNSTNMNVLVLGIDRNGNRQILVSDSAAWRKALGLETATTTTTVSKIFTPASWFTVTSASLTTFGKVAMLYIEGQNDGNIRSGTHTFGTIISGKRPAADAAIGYTNQYDSTGYIQSSDGAIKILKSSGSIAANAVVIIMATYIMA